MTQAGDALTQLVHAQVPYTVELGLEIVEGSPDEVVGRADWTAERCTAGGVLHGGFLMACADSMGALLAFLNLPEGAIGTTTIESKTNMVGSVLSGSITISATPLHVGRTTAVIRTDITTEAGDLVSRTVQTQLALRPGS